MVSSERIPQPERAGRLEEEASLAFSFSFPEKRCTVTAKLRLTLLGWVPSACL